MELKHSPKFLRQRRFFVVLPFLTLPFATFFFWALGGGKVEQTGAQQSQAGLNMQLPGAHLKEGKPQDKLSYYEQASSDSLKLVQQMRNDPYYALAYIDTSHMSLGAVDTALFSANNYESARTNVERGYSDPNEAKVNRKLAELNAALNKSTPQATYSYESSSADPTNSIATNNDDIDRLEAMMQTMNSSTGTDPEMQQLNSMLETILDIQHPERARDKIRLASAAARGQVFPVAISSPSLSISLLDKSSNSSADRGGRSTAQNNGFYSLTDDAPIDVQQNAIDAVVHQTQTLIAGSTVKLRLLNDVFVNSILIPKNNFLYGIAALSGERLGIKINSVRYQNSLFPVALAVYDLDGLEGIYVPGAITRDVAKESADRSVQQLGYNTVDPSIAGQAAAVGIEAAKTLFSRKVKLIKVTVKAGYHVFLRDDRQD